MIHLYSIEITHILGWFKESYTVYGCDMEFINADISVSHVNSAINTSQNYGSQDYTRVIWLV